MSLTLVFLLLASLFEALLLGMVLVFFLRLKRSEALLSSLQEKHERVMAKLRFNAELEQEMVSSFAERQKELAALDKALSARVAELKDLVDKARSVSRSPRLLREVVIEGRRQGKSTQSLALSTGLSVDEVELLLEEKG